MRRKTVEKEKGNEKKIVCIRSERVFIRREIDKIQPKWTWGTVTDYSIWERA